MNAEEYESQFNRWLYLMNAVRVLRLQDAITPEFEEDLVENLLFFKPNQDEVK